MNRPASYSSEDSNLLREMRKIFERCMMKDLGTVCELLAAGYFHPFEAMNWRFMIEGYEPPPTTPELFAEYRERERELPPGPAFIPLEKEWNDPSEPPWWVVEWHGVPDDYLWQPATEGSGAGWVRPHGGVRE